MSAVNGHARLEPFTTTDHVAAAERFARATVFAFELCEAHGAPLSQMQKAALIEASLLEFDGLESTLATHASVDALLRSLLPVAPLAGKPR